MSKRSLFWGQAAGKLGEAVYYRAGGEQRTRAYIAQVKNPRSLAQQLNRASMANLSSFYRATKALLAYSMTNRKSNQSAFNLFVKKSKNADTPAIPLDNAQQGYNIPLGCAIASGSAAWDAAPAVVGDTTGNGAVALAVGVGVQLPGVSAESIVAWAGPADAKAAIASMLLARGSWFDGLPRVFKLNTIVNEYDEEGGRNFIRSITIDGSGISSFESENGNVSALVVSGDFSASRHGVRPFGLATTIDGRQRIAVAVGLPGNKGNGWIIAGAFVSYKDENKRVQCSNSYMQKVYEGAGMPIAQYLPGGDIYNDVVAKYGIGESDPLAVASENVTGGAVVTPPAETPTYTISLTSSNESRGTVEGGGTYEQGESITIKAIAKSGYRFISWSDGNTSATRTIVVQSNLSLTATFDEEDENGGSVVG